MRQTTSHRERQTGSILLVAIGLIAVMAMAIFVYSQAALSRNRTVQFRHDLNRGFNLAEISLNEAIHELNKRFDGVDNDGDGTTDETDEGNPSMGTTAWDMGVDDLGADGIASTYDRGEGDEHPTFGEPNVVPIASGAGFYYAWTVDWGTNNKDDNGDGAIDDVAESGIYATYGAGREGGTGGAIYTITVVVAPENLNVWNNAIFAGDSGVGSARIQGNALVHGSIHILGDSLDPTDPALDMNGTSGQRNDYTGIDVVIDSKIPDLAVGADLNAKLRVKNGYVGLSGNAMIGDATLDVDGVYVNDGFGGTAGEENVYSANGVDHLYDLPEGTVSFPFFSDGPYTDPDTQVVYATFKSYYTSTSFHINAAAVPGWNGVINKTTPSFSVGDANGSFVWDQATGKITIDGKVTVDGNLTLGGTTGATRIDFSYSGRGSIVSQAAGGQLGDIVMHGDLLPETTFPTGDVLGLMAEHNMDLPAAAQKKLCGAFYAQGKLTSAKQNEVGGTFVASEVDMGSQVPRIYQVPALAGNLPPGMIGADAIVLFTRLSWREHGD